MDKTVFTIPLDDKICAFSTFRSVRERQSNAFFFEGACATGEKPATSVIGVGPFKRVEGPIFKALGEAEIGSNVTSDADKVPYFHGGFFGCIGYDSVTELEPKLAACGNFADLSKESIQVFYARDLIVFDHTKKLVHFIGDSADFVSFLKTRTALEITRVEVAPERLSAALGRKNFFSGVQSLKEHIREGNIFQAVLSERFECDIEVKAIDIFAALRLISPAPYSFFFSFDSREFFGASPEALLKVENGRLCSHPIAGTRPRGETEIQDKKLQRQLESSRKEAAEHLMLVDLARNDLGRVARAGSVKVNEYRSVRKFSNVMHLASEVGAELDTKHSVIDALGACFPAGTLSGAPKIRAMEILAGIEKVPRGFYGGAVIAFDHAAKRLDTCIAIRSLEVTNGKAILRAGAGIVADSKPDFEYAEIEHKLKPLRQAIAMAESLK